MAEIELANGRGVALVDDADLAIVSPYSWCVGKGYAIRTDRTGPRQRTVQMHRMILDPGVGKFVDHINGDKLDNRRKNLRAVTKGVNAFNTFRVRPDNTVGARGISLRPALGKWEARITFDGKTTYLGAFESLSGAVRARAEAELKMYGEICKPTADYLASFS